MNMLGGHGLDSLFQLKLSHWNFTGFSPSSPETTPSSPKFSLVFFIYQPTLLNHQKTHASLMLIFLPSIFLILYMRNHPPTPSPLQALPSHQAWQLPATLIPSNLHIGASTVHC